jgi:Putative bacterial sensory transduction regulator
MADAQFMTVSPEQMGEIIQSSGFRAEHRTDTNGIPLIASATNGINFNIRMGNRAAAPAEGFMDFTYLTIIKVEGEFPAERLNEWNRNRRFSRLHRVDDFVVLDMDVVVAGGVTERHIRATLELWERMLQELMNWLRGDTPANAA